MCIYFHYQKSLISALEEQLEEYDEHVKTVEIEDLNRKSDSNESVGKEPSDSEFDESGTYIHFCIYFLL